MSASKPNSELVKEELAKHFKVADASIDRYINLFAFNFALSHFEADDRKIFYELAAKKDYKSLEDLIYLRIPNFDTLLKNELLNSLKVTHE